MQAWIARGWVKWGIHFILVAAVAVVSLRTTGEARYEFCVKLEAVRTYARDQAERSLTTVPTLAYYKEHPEELEDVLDQIRRQKRAFSPPLDC